MVRQAATQGGGRASQGGGGNARGRERMLSLRGPGTTSLNPMKPDSENPEPHT